MGAESTSAPSSKPVLEIFGGLEKACGIQSKVQEAEVWNGTDDFPTQGFLKVFLHKTMAEKNFFPLHT